MVQRYLAEARTHDREWVTDAKPLRQPVTVKSASWRLFLAGRDLHPEVRSGADLALDLIAGSGDLVDRALLTTMSAEVGSSPERSAACWFAVMCWGAGPQNRSRLRQWARAMPAPGFVRALDESYLRYRSGDLVGAYRWSLMPGVGEAYATKWLWVLGLADPAEGVVPHVLDARVWAVLRRLRWQPTGGNRPERWVNSCQVLASWAHELGTRRPDWHLDGDRLEQLMFDRRTGGQTFHSWLASAPLPESGGGRL